MAAMNMTAPFLTRVLVAGAAGGILGIAGLSAAAPVLAATPAAPVHLVASPNPAASPRTGRDGRQDRRQIAAAVFAAEAEVLGMTPAELRAALRTRSLAAIAGAKGIATEAAFAARLGPALKPRLDALVTRGAITQAQEDRILDAVSRGRVPGWHHVPGTHHRGHGPHRGAIA